MSLPVNIDFNFKPTAYETASLDTYMPPSYTRDINITKEEANQKRAVFESTKQQSIDELNAKKQLLEAAIISQLPPTELKVYYFIGRLNPPHPGHIETLRNLIDTAKTNTNGGLFRVVILLGSGPNGGVQTLNDPLPFRLKRKVVIDLLKEKGVPDIDDLLTSGKVTIEEMGKAASQISDIIKRIIKINETIIDIETVRFSGDKDEDMEKLSWIEKSIANSLRPIEITTNVVGIAAVENEDSGTAMSATIVRNNALESYLSELKNTERKRETGRERDDRDISGLEMFKHEYEDIYIGNTEKVYNAIIDQAKIFNPEEIQKYINFKILPGTSEKKDRKKKGGSRKRRRLTKRKKHRKTKRRKSRKHRKSKRRRH